MDTQPRKSDRLAADLASGLGIGLLLGLVLGLSTTPVVAVVVGALTSLLAALLGLAGGQTADASQPSLSSRLQINGLRIGSLGLAAVAGVFIGLYVRINNPLAESPKAQLARWEAAFPDNPTLAQQMMIYERHRLVPGTMKLGPDFGTTVTAAAGPDTRSAVLFSQLQGKALCRDLAPVAYGNDVTKQLRAWGDQGPPLSKLAQSVGTLPAEQQAPALAGAHALLCDLEQGRFLK
jgi:hypothetical protein